MKERNIPKKNYFILVLMLISIVVLTFATVNIFKWIKSNNVRNGYINKYVSEITYNELDTYLLEPASNTFIYITYTGNEQVYKLEKDLKKIISNYDLTDEFIYIDVTEEMENNDFIKNINEKYSTNLINKIPVIMYFKDGVLTDIINSDDNLFTKADFQKLLDNYEIAN